MPLFLLPFLMAVSADASSLAEPDPPLDSVVAAAHHGTWTADGISWESRFLFRDHTKQTILLVMPIAGDARLIHSRGLRPEYDSDGALVAFERSPLGGDHLVRVWQPVDREKPVLRPPLSQGSAVQRITLNGVVFSPRGLGLDQYVGFNAQPEVSRGDRAWLDRRFDEFPVGATDRQAIYLLADSRVKEAGGIPGVLSLGGDVGSTVFAVVGGLFFTVLGLLVLAYRRLDRNWKIETSDSYIEREFI